MLSSISPDIRRHYLRCYARMLRDLDIETAALMVNPDLSLHDGGSNRRLSPPLGNQTLAEGLVAAVKLAELQLEQDAHMIDSAIRGPVEPVAAQ